MRQRSRCGQPDGAQQYRRFKLTIGLLTPGAGFAGLSFRLSRNGKAFGDRVGSGPRGLARAGHVIIRWAIGRILVDEYLRWAPKVCLKA